MERKFAVVTDSTCDLSKELRENFDIHYVPMNYVIDDKEYPASLDWESHSAREFYDLMRNGTRIRTTQVPRDVYTQYFSKLVEQDLDILYISCSSALSGTINVANMVGRQIEAVCPGRRIICVDSLISSLGQGKLCIRAARLRDRGADVETAAEELRSLRLTVNQLGTVDSLEYLRRVGRVTAPSAFFGNLFGVKPILISDCLGQNYAVKKVKGALNVRKEIAAMTAELVTDPQDQYLYLSHADSEETAKELRDLILETVPFKGCIMNCIGPIVGASVGPGTLIAFFYGQRVTVNDPEAADK